MYKIQKASLWKRFSAALLDFIVMMIIATGIMTIISYVVDYDSKYEEEYREYFSKLLPKIKEKTDSLNSLGISYVRKPIFDISVSSQKSNPFSVTAQNELAKELYNLGFFNPEMADQAIMCLEMMSFEGKEQVIERIRSNSSGAFYEGNIPHENQVKNITSSDESYLVKAFKDTFPGKTTLSEARRVRGI